MMIKQTLTLLAICTMLFLSCTSAVKHNSLSEKEKSDGWELLFNGHDINNWHSYNQGKSSSKWLVKDGEILCDPSIKTGIFADLTSNESYENFDLKFDWKVAKAGNSGVFINVQEDPKYKATFATGLEMQLLDNANAEQRHQIDTTHWAGCLYAVKCIGTNSLPHAFNEWNESRIIQNNGKVSFYLNGKLTFEQQTNGTDWNALIAASNMKNYPDFGKFKSGKIALQNHTDAVSFRNIKIKIL